MGQAGSTQLASAQRRVHVGSRSSTLPHEPPRLAPKVLPSLAESPRLRCTDNGAILHSGGTISGRRPLSHLATTPRSQHHNAQSGVYRSRSANGEPNASDHHHHHHRPRERDPLHRSHTNLDLRDNGDKGSKRFGSEPDLRIEEEQPKPRGYNKHFRKKYKAPPPPAHENTREGSSPDSCDGSSRPHQGRKLRLFKTRTETKKLSSQEHETKFKPAYRSSSSEFRSHSETVIDNQSLERRFKSPCKDRDQYLQYPDSKDRNMVQSPSSLRREEHIIQDSNSKNQSRTGKCINNNKYKPLRIEEKDLCDDLRTPYLERNFRYSERFKREEIEQPILRREKSFDSTLLKDRETTLNDKKQPTSEQFRNSKNLRNQNEERLRTSLPSLLNNNIEEKDKFQAELKKATSRIRSEVSKNVKRADLANPEKTSQNDSKLNKVNSNQSNYRKPSSQINKVKASSPKTGLNALNRPEHNLIKKVDSKRCSRTVISTKPELHQNNNRFQNTREILRSKQENKICGDRGQASGKESTPEHSPTRIRELQKPKERDKPAPSKQFYFGMIESKEVDANKNLKEFPGLGSPIIEEISNFHIIEKKLLRYENTENNKFTTAPHNPEPKTVIKNLSSESALSSSEEEVGSDNSLGIALSLRPTIPKKQLEVPRFSPAAAWRQLAQLDTQTPPSQPLAVEIKMEVATEPAAESPPRSDKSGDKSADSGISGDHAHSDERLDSPSRPHDMVCERSEAVGGDSAWTPQQDLGDSSSDGAGGSGDPAVALRSDGLVTYSARGQPFSLSLPRDSHQDKTKQFQQPFNSLQKLKKSVSGALGALGSRRFELEHEPMEEPEQNWFLTKSAPNSLSNPLLHHTRTTKASNEGDIKEEATPPTSDQEEEPESTWRSGAGAGTGSSYLSWGGHVMYLPPAPHDLSSPTKHKQPLSLLATFDRPVRSKSSGELEVKARAVRAARALAGEMRERERSASPPARALPARVQPVTGTGRTHINTIGDLRTGSAAAAGRRDGRKRFTFQSTVRQLERKRLAEKLSREADLKEQQRRTELEAMRRVEEEFQRKRAREKASIRQQLRLVSGATSLPPLNTQTKQASSRDEPDGAVSARESPAPSAERSGSSARPEKERQRHSNTSSEISNRSKSTTPVRCVELSEWRVGGGAGARQYRDWGTSAHAQHAHPPACARMPRSPAPALYIAHNGTTEVEAFSGSPRSDNYRLEFARGVTRSPRSPRTPRAPRLLAAPPSPSTSGSELSAPRYPQHQHAIRLRW